MPIFRLQVAWQIDSAFPRDAMVITPHFNDVGITTDADSLCEDLATALEAWDTTPTQVTVKAYDAQGTPPVFPTGSAIRNEGVIASSNWPREVAVCLSYYSEQNVPRKRGRLYIPIGVMGSANTLRPEGAVRTKVGELAAIFADLGGPDVDWCVYSRMDDTARSVSHWWVDDEWDTVRSRGMRATTRTLGTVSE
jgi:hypothetical protein